MAFEMQIVSNTPLVGEEDLDTAAKKFFEQIGYLSKGADPTIPYKIFADFFLKRYCERDGKRIMGITRDALECLTHFEWPGNVRELENVIERAVVLAQGDRIGLAELPEWITGIEGRPRHVCIPIGTPLREAERHLIEAYLRHTAGDKSAAAGLLGITRRTIYRKLGDALSPDGAGPNDR